MSVVVLALSAVGATANPEHHPAKGQPATSGEVAMPGPAGMMSMMRCPTMGGHTEGSLAFLKTELKINDAQASAWNVFADAYREFATSKSSKMMQQDAMMGRGDGNAMGQGPMSAMSYPQRMTGHMEMMKAQLEAGQKFEVAVDALYAALTADQKKSADDLLPKFTMMGHMM
jgi:hypothetical protein